MFHCIDSAAYDITCVLDWSNTGKSGLVRFVTNLVPLSVLAILTLPTPTASFGGKNGP